jgi:hypothetical protein
MYNFFDDRLFRHDLTLTMTSITSEDSSNVFNASCYFSHSENERTYPVVLFSDKPDTLTRQFYSSRQVGATASWEFSLKNIIGLRAGGEGYYTNLDESYFTQAFSGITLSAYGLAEFRPLKPVLLTGGARWTQRDNRTAVSFGAGSHFLMSDKVTFFADFSFSERLPSPAENISLKKEANSLMLAEIEYAGNDMKFNIGGFARRVENPIEYEYDSVGTVPVFARAINANNRTIFGAVANFECKITKAIFGKVWAQSYFSQRSSENTELLPPLYGGLSAYYEIIRGESVLHLGFNFKAIAPFKGERFYPIARNTQENTLESQFVTNGLDLTATAKLGNTFLRIAWQNVLDQVYYYVPYYPQGERAFKISLSWNFLN